jgi:hypothetical protein
MPHVCFAGIVTEQTLKEWWHWHKSRVSAYEPHSRMAKFHRKAAEEVQLRMIEVRMANALKVKMPFNWKTFCEAYRPKL